MPISGIFNMFSQLAQNSWNSLQAQINRRWQEQMYEKQYQDNINLWKMQQDYNTPANQVARLKEAGINPYLALQNINTGSAQSAPQSAQAGSGAQATGTPVNFAGLTQSVYNLLKLRDERQLLKEQSQNLASDSLGKRIDAITKHQKNMAEIVGILKGSERDAASAALNRSLKTTEDELRGFKRQEFMNNAFESVFRQLSQLQMLHAFPTLKRVEIAESLSRAALNRFNSQSDFSKVIHDAEQLIGRKMNKKEKEQLFEAMKKSVIFEPQKGMTSAGAAATIGSVIGTGLKSWWNDLWK